MAHRAPEANRTRAEEGRVPLQADRPGTHVDPANAQGPPIQKQGKAYSSAILFLYLFIHLLIHL
jgi:hypothetical protein